MKQAVGLVGWRGMVGSVLMQRMRDENDFALIEPVFSPPATLAAPRPPGPMARARCRTPTTSTLSKTAHHHYRAGWRLHLRDLPEAARRGLERHLDRRRQHPAHGRRRHHRAGPGQPPGHRRGAQARRAQLHRRQLHGQLHADGPGRPVQQRPGRVDDHHDLPGGLGRWRAAHARTADSSARSTRRSSRCWTIPRPPSWKSTAACWPSSRIRRCPTSTSACRWAAT